MWTNQRPVFRSRDLSCPIRGEHYLEDEGGELVPHVHDVGVATGAARGAHKVLLDLDHRLGVLALLAEDELLDEAVQHVLELALVMASIDDVALSLKCMFLNELHYTLEEIYGFIGSIFRASKKIFSSFKASF